jgi:hypothetical protein
MLINIKIKTISTITIEAVGTTAAVVPSTKTSNLTSAPQKEIEIL